MKKTKKHKFILLTKKRERKRISRKKIKLTNSYNKKINIKKKCRRLRNPIKIVIPSTLDLFENRDKLIDLILKIREVILHKKDFSIDHRMMSSISDEALLLLTSEIERCTSVVGIKLKALRRLYPKKSNIINLLDKIGYWDYFNLNSNNKNKSVKNEKFYLKIVGDTKVSGEKIGNLIEFFQTLICFESDARDKFSDAMLEAAANTVEHAYTKPGAIETINKWWLTASLNKITKEISFIFYDQGLGVLNTLESSNKHIRLKRVFMGWINEGLSKGGILKNLMTTNLSSYKDERRGNGLISFKTFIDEVEGGELTIFTDNVSYSAISDSINNYSNNIDGTLISWRIKVNCESSKCIYLKKDK